MNIENFLNKKQLATTAVTYLITMVLCILIFLFTKLLIKRLMDQNKKENNNCQIDFLDLSSVGKIYLPQNTEKILQQEVDEWLEGRTTTIWEFNGIGGQGKTLKVSEIAKRYDCLVMRVSIGDFFRTSARQYLTSKSTITEDRFKCILQKAQEESQKADKKVIILFDEIDKFLPNNSRKVSFTDSNTEKFNELFTYVYQIFGNSNDMNKLGKIKLVFCTNTRMFFYLPEGKNNIESFIRRVKPIEFGYIDGYALNNWCNDYNIKGSTVGECENLLKKLKEAVSKEVDIKENIQIPNEYNMKLLEKLLNAAKKKHGDQEINLNFLMNEIDQTVRDARSEISSIKSIAMNEMEEAYATPLAGPSYFSR